MKESRFSAQLYDFQAAQGSAQGQSQICQEKGKKKKKGQITAKQIVTNILTFKKTKVTLKETRD